MTETLTITLNDEQARAAFTDLVNRATDMTGLMRQVSGHLAERGQALGRSHSIWLVRASHRRQSTCAPRRAPSGARFFGAHFSRITAMRSWIAIWKNV